MEQKIFNVTQLNEYVKALIESDGALSGVYVRGELSNYKVYPSGHHYFTMKDASGALRCVMFRGSASKMRFKPENGMSVVAFGRVSVFPRDGAYQLYVNEVTPDGVGDLYVAYEQLKEKLLKEGLFDAQYKKPIPRFPDRIAVITSSAGAAVRDIIRVLGKRWPLSKVIILPVRVQGTEAPMEITGAIRYANRYNIANLIITGRGGGSIEDLWAFNDERVVRAVFESVIPVISAVGHEPDVTISDFVADLRAATPSNGAELAVPDIAELREVLKSLDLRAGQALSRELQALRRRLDDLQSKRVLQSPKNTIDDKRMILDFSQERLNSAAMSSFKAAREKYIHLAASLDAMSPLKVLGRGYSVTQREDGHVVKKASDVKSGDKITVQFQKDKLSATID